jgi:hypothetical protein
VARKPLRFAFAFGMVLAVAVTWSRRNLAEPIPPETFEFVLDAEGQP